MTRRKHKRRRNYPKLVVVVSVHFRVSTMTSRPVSGESKGFQVTTLSRHEGKTFSRRSKDYESTRVSRIRPK